MKRYAFIDRDGCIIEEPADQQVDALSKIRLMPGVIPALKSFAEAGYDLIMVTNQDGLGTPSFPEADFHLCQDFVLALLSSQGITFRDILVCPHFLRDGCSCRKPKTGLLTAYLKDSAWRREDSFVVGDRATDRELAQNLGVKGFLIGPELSWAQIAHTILNQPRQALVVRKTSETKIAVTVDLDGDGLSTIQSGIGFLDHMLTSFAKHSGYSLTLSCEGDLWVDDHHTTEDIALALGGAIREALGNKVGIGRFGFLLPMDEALATVALDLSGRAYFVFDGAFHREKVGELATELVPHFFRSLAEALGANLHIKVTGDNEHHKIEAMFKGVAKSLGQATAKSQGQGIPSTKGSL